MVDMVRMADRRLAGLVETLGVFTAPIDPNLTIIANVITFNPKGTELRLDDRPLGTGTFFCITADPPIRSYEKGIGEVFVLRLFPGAMNRLLGIDPRVYRGVHRSEPERHPKLAQLEDAFTKEICNPLDQVSALERRLIALLDDCEPEGLPERFVALISAREGNIQIAEAAAELEVSVRTLERQCRKRFGRTPKRIARGYRAARTWMREEASGERPETMPDFTFSDLPHYARELRRVSGLTRSEHREQHERDLILPYDRLWTDGRKALTEREILEWRRTIAFGLNKENRRM